MPTKAPISLEELKKYPMMTRWFHPGLLLKLLWRVVVSDLFGQYADRRLIVAALDTENDPELVKRTQITLPRDDDGALWIDFVADLGDGFDSTYAIATLLAQESLTVDEHQTQRGRLLIMGGDEVYPTASAATYQKQLRDPYGWAFPDPNPKSADGPLVYCMPGNHDWYDGLVVFLALFCRKEKLHLGGWRSQQRRSYFALQLTEQWWLWCVDTQLDDDIDQPQKDYFALIAKNMPEGSNIILCGPEPGWQYTLRVGSKSFDIMDYIGWIAKNANRRLSIPIVLSGDTHHYSRYSSDDGVTQFITSGGGGAFLHPTHQLRDTIAVEWTGRNSVLSLKTEPSAGHAPALAPACYPTREKSADLLKGDFKFVVTNWEFAAVLGVFYWLLALCIHHWWPDGFALTWLVFFFAFWRYTVHQEGGGSKVFWVSAANSVPHTLAVTTLTFVFDLINASFPVLHASPRTSFLLFAIEMIVAGGIVGGFLFGAYLYATCRWLDLNHNDAFSSMRLNTFRHFLRIRIKGNEVTIIPVGLDSVPSRDDWERNPNWKDGKSTEPAYRPKTQLTPHLVEDPIVVQT